MSSEVSVRYLNGADSYAAENTCLAVQGEGLSAQRLDESQPRERTARRSLDVQD